ncbi:MAG TPA: hypothetical protein VFS21_02150 [Roseiflexaceae bacterium]|nr:hypothetical protein [Roseiflexaceae bacterium]
MVVPSPSEEERKHLEDIYKVLQRRLRIRETQLAQQEQLLPPRQRRQLLRPQIEEQEQALAQLNERLAAGSIDATLAERLAGIHRRNLELLGEMLAGKRAYVALPLVLEIEDIRRQMSMVAAKLQIEEA